MRIYTDCYIEQLNTYLYQILSLNTADNRYQLIYLIIKCNSPHACNFSAKYSYNAFNAKQLILLYSGSLANDVKKTYSRKISIGGMFPKWRTNVEHLPHFLMN